MGGRRTRLAILHDWQAEGRSPCPVCGTLIEPDGRFRVSQLWQAVVHPYCLYARVGRPSLHDLERHACPFYPDCPIPFLTQRAEYCVCPVTAARNLIFLARRFGEPRVNGRV
jgi:hypothetical protein